MKAIKLKQAAEMLANCGIADIVTKLREGKIPGIQPFGEYRRLDQGKRGAALFVYEEDVKCFLDKRERARQQKLQPEKHQFVANYRPVIEGITRRIGYCPDAVIRSLTGRNKHKKKIAV